jgi:hypothetical protein
MTKKDEALRDCVVKLGYVKCYFVFEDVSDRSLIITTRLETFQAKISLILGIITIAFKVQQGQK